MTFRGAGAAGNFPHPLGSRARVLAKQEEAAAAAAGKVGVAPLPPLAWGLRIPARTWERWSHLGGRRGADPCRLWSQLLVPSYVFSGAQAREKEVEKGSPVGCALPPGSLLFPFCSPISGTTGRTFKTEHKIHLLTQPMYLQAQGHVKPASLSHPLPAHRWAEPKRRWVGERALDKRNRRQCPITNVSALPLGFWRGAQGLASMNEELLHELWRWVALGDCVSGVTGHHRDKVWRAIRQPRKCCLV